MKQWYLLKCKAREENRAKENLINQNYQTYLPLMKVARRLRGKSRESIEAMFPGYLFIQLDTDNDNWGPIRSTRGVLQIIRFGALPTPLPKTIIDELIKREIDGVVESFDSSQFQPGEKIRVREGCFKGLEAVFECQNGVERAMILLDIVGKSTRVCVATTLLDKQG